MGNTKQGTITKPSPNFVSFGSISNYTYWELPPTNFYAGIKPLAFQESQGMIFKTIS